MVYDRRMVRLQQVTAADVAVARALNALFGAAFNERATYEGEPPADDYVSAILAKDQVIVLVAFVEDELAGGLVAYELPKLERARSEIYIYDLAVGERHRRKGIASALIDRLRAIGAERGAWVIYVQADYTDPPAIALYEKLGSREEVLHFDIPVPPRR